MNQYYSQGRHLKIIMRTMLIALIVVGLIAPFTFLKENILTTTQVQKINQGNSKIESINSVKVTGKIDRALTLKQKAHELDVMRRKARLLHEKPLHNVNIPNFVNISDVREKKRKFFAFITPAIEAHHKQIFQQREVLIALKNKYSLTNMLSEDESQLIAHLTKKYKVKSSYGVLSHLDGLLNKIDIVPVPLTLVQAANESAWGTSRFSRIGLNFFGIWCFNKGCGMVPSGRDLDADHEVEAFKSVDDAIRKYTYNINTNNAYINFRKIRKQLRDENLPLSSEALATGLVHYSERGDAYVAELIEMIRYNQQYFSYSL